MISQIITNSFGSIKLDVTTVAALAFSSFLIISLFVKLHEVLASRTRVNRRVQRLVERDKANVIYTKKVYEQAVITNKNSKSISKTKSDYLNRNAMRLLGYTTSKVALTKSVYNPQNGPHSKRLAASEKKQQASIERFNKTSLAERKGACFTKLSNPNYAFSKAL